MTNTISSNSSLLLQARTPSPASRVRGAPSKQRWRMIRAEASASSAGGSIILNPSIKKEEAKVVDTVLVSDLQKPLQAYCRCWRSKTFPLCDGTHAKHNKETGDNVGPLLLKK